MKILAPGFYARQDMRTPVRIAFVTLLVSQTLAVILMFQIGHAGLTLSTSLGACLNAALLYRAMRRARHLRADARAGAGFLWRVAGRALRAGRRAVVDRRRRRLLARGGAVGEGRAARAGHRRAARVAYFGALWLVGFRLADFNRREALAS